MLEGWQWKKAHCYVISKALPASSSGGSDRSYAYQLQQAVEPVHFLSKDSGQGVEASLRILDEKALGRTLHFQGF